MYVRVAIHLLLGIGIFIFVTGAKNSAKAADTKLTGYVYEFDEKFERQDGLGQVTVTVRSKEGTVIADPKTSDKDTVL